MKKMIGVVLILGSLLGASTSYSEGVADGIQDIITLTNRALAEIGKKQREIDELWRTLHIAGVRHPSNPSYAYPSYANPNTPSTGILYDISVNFPIHVDESQRNGRSEAVISFPTRINRQVEISVRGL